MIFPMQLEESSLIHCCQILGTAIVRPIDDKQTRHLLKISPIACHDCCTDRQCNCGNSHILLNPVFSQFWIILEQLLENTIGVWCEV